MVDRVFGFLALFIFLSALAVVISKRSNTVAVLNASLGGLNKLQKTALSPIVK